MDGSMSSGQKPVGGNVQWSNTVITTEQSQKFENFSTDTTDQLLPSTQGVSSPVVAVPKAEPSVGPKVATETVSPAAPIAPAKKDLLAQALTSTRTKETVEITKSEERVSPVPPPAPRIKTRREKVFSGGQFLVNVMFMGFLVVLALSLAGIGPGIFKQGVVAQKNDSPSSASVDEKVDPKPVVEITGAYDKEKDPVVLKLRALRNRMKDASVSSKEKKQ